MKKENIVSWVVYILMIGIALLLGFTILKDLVSQLSSTGNIPFDNPFLFSALIVLTAIIFNSLMIEVGHVIGALIGGYSIISFNFLWLCLYKKEGKWRFGFKGFDGLTGETKIKPKKQAVSKENNEEVQPKKEKLNPRPYVVLPFILYLIELTPAIIFLVIYYSNPNALGNASWLTVASFLFAAVGGLIILYDYVPVRLDAMNDGFRLTLIQNKTNKDAFNLMLDLEADEFDGKKLVLPAPFEDITDYTARINLLIVYDYLSHGEFEQALALIEMTTKDEKKVSNEVYNSLEGLKLFIKCKNSSKAELSEYYGNLDSETKKAVSSCKQIESNLAYLYISVIAESSRYEVEFAQKKFVKNLKHTDGVRKQIVENLYNDSVRELAAEYPAMFKEE